MVSDRIYDDIPSQMKVLNMVIPIIRKEESKDQESIQSKSTPDSNIPAAAGDHKAARNRQDSICQRQTRNTNDKNDPQKKHALLQFRLKLGALQAS